jgi:hypothetical protein
LLAASVMTLRDPAGIVAGNARLVWGSAGAVRAAAERAIGRDNPGPIAIARGDNGSPTRPIRRIRPTSCWLSSTCCSAGLSTNSSTPPE